MGLVAAALLYAGITAVLFRVLLPDLGTHLFSDPGDPLLLTAVIAWNARHLPLTDVHPNAALAAQAAEAAGAQGRFWEMHDLLFANQDALDVASLRRHAARLRLDADQFEKA